jgi:hypothetical protein
MAKLNDELRKLYASNWETISEILQDIAYNDPDPQPTNPFLLYIDNEDKWLNADLRVMIFGQETNDWEELGKPIDHLLNVYDGFFNKGECWSYGGHFFNGISRFEFMLAAKYPDKKIHYVWNNIIKIGKANEPGRPPKNIYEVEYEFFHVIPEEVKILKPNILLFLTGHSYANEIRNNFGEISYTAISPYTEKQLARLNIPSVDFAFRTYNPHYLWMHNINNYFDSIIKEITL